MDGHYAVVRTWHRHSSVNPEAVGAQCGRVARRFSAGALWGCGFKTGCHEAGSTENRPRTSSPVKTKAPTRSTRLPRVSEGKYVQFNQILTHSEMQSGPQAAIINTRFAAAPQKGVSFTMATSHGAPHLCNVSWSDISWHKTLMWWMCR